MGCVHLYLARSQSHSTTARLDRLPVRGFEYFGCVPKIVVPDRLKSAVSRACRYEPEINPTYADMASHYGVCVIPARPARPRDKAKVENGVLIAKRWILSVLRHRRFYTLADLNTAIGELLERLNNRALRKLKQSRRELFVLFDQPNALHCSHAFALSEGLHGVGGQPELWRFSPFSSCGTL